MSNVNFEFNTFYHQIGPCASQKKMTRDVRRSLRNRIRQYFREKLNLRSPVFFSRGRQATATSVLLPDGEIVLEEGVLLRHLDKGIIHKWPEPKIVHRMMLAAIRDQTPDPSIDKNYSVCAQYSGLYRIEIAILAPGPDSHLLAIDNALGWQPDIQERLATWFENRIKQEGLQLRRVASYLNAWADFHPNRLEEVAWLLPLDILAARYFRADIERDDRSLALTAAAIVENAPYHFQGLIPLAGENPLSWLLSRQQNQKFIQSLEVLAKRSQVALTAKDKMHACAIWRSLLGGRFPLPGVSRRKYLGRANGWQPNNGHANPNLA